MWYKCIFQQKGLGHLFMQYFGDFQKKMQKLLKKNAKIGQKCPILSYFSFKIVFFLDTWTLSKKAKFGAKYDLAPNNFFSGPNTFKTGQICEIWPASGPNGIPARPVVKLVIQACLPY